MDVIRPKYISLKLFIKKIIKISLLTLWPCFSVNPCPFLRSFRQMDTKGTHRAIGEYSAKY